MYAVVFDFDSNCSNGCYVGGNKVVRYFMMQNGFSHIQGGVYFGNSSVDAVRCVLTIQSLVKAYPWVETCSKEVRMLRIEENSDLLPAIQNNE